MDGRKLPRDSEGRVKVHLPRPPGTGCHSTARRRTSEAIGWFAGASRSTGGAVRLSNPGHSSGPWDGALAEKVIDVVTWCMRLFLKQASGVGRHPRFANTSSSDLALI